MIYIDTPQEEETLTQYIGAMRQHWRTLDDIVSPINPIPYWKWLLQSINHHGGFKATIEGDCIVFNHSNWWCVVWHGIVFEFYGYKGCWFASMLNEDPIKAIDGLTPDYSLLQALQFWLEIRKWSEQ